MGWVQVAGRYILKGMTKASRMPSPDIQPPSRPKHQYSPLLAYAAEAWAGNGGGVRGVRGG